MVCPHKYKFSERKIGRRKIIFQGNGNNRNNRGVVKGVCTHEETWQQIRMNRNRPLLYPFRGDNKPRFDLSRIILKQTISSLIAGYHICQYFHPSSKLISNFLSPPLRFPLSAKVWHAAVKVILRFISGRAPTHFRDRDINEENNRLRAANNIKRSQQSNLLSIQFWFYSIDGESWKS